MFTPLASLPSIAPLDNKLFDHAKPQSSSDPTGMFVDIFAAAIEDVRTTDAEKNHTQYLLATGQLDNPAEATLAATKAATSVELLIALRTKAMDAYSEMMRINL